MGDLRLQSRNVNYENAAWIKPQEQVILATLDQHHAKLHQLVADFFWEERCHITQPALEPYFLERQFIQGDDTQNFEAQSWTGFHQSTYNQDRLEFMF